MKKQCECCRDEREYFCYFRCQDGAEVLVCDLCYDDFMYMEKLLKEDRDQGTIMGVRACEVLCKVAEHKGLVKVRQNFKFLQRRNWN